MYNDILDYLPYKSTFRFVDEISLLDEDQVAGHYTLKQDEFFYEDHFPGNPVTPGVILTEIMAQIGLVVLGIYLTVNAAEFNKKSPVFPLLTSSEVSFYKMVLPGQKVEVISKKEYFRLGKLKCQVQMLDADKELIARGVFSGILKSK